MYSVWIKVLTCIGDSESEHLPAVFVLLSELPEDVALSLSGESVGSLGRIQNAHLAESVGDLDVGIGG